MLHPYCPCNAELMLTFGGEHYEDQEDQEHPRCYGELSEEDEEGGEDLFPLIGSFYGVLLDWIGFEVVGREDGLDLVYGLVRVPAALDCRTPVGDEDLVDSTFLADVLLQVPKRHHHRDIRGGVGSALVDPGYLQLGRAWLGGKRPYLRIGGRPSSVTPGGRAPLSNSAGGFPVPGPPGRRSIRGSEGVSAFGSVVGPTREASPAPNSLFVSNSMDDPFLSVVKRVVNSR